MHRVVAFDDFGWQYTVSEHRYLLVAMAMAVLHELMTGDYTDVYPDAL